VRYSFLISILIHSLFFGLIFYLTWDKVNHKKATYVSLLTGHQDQSSRLKKVKGSIENKPDPSKHTENVLKTNSSLLKGQDKENVEERLSSSSNNSNPAFMSYAQELQIYIEKNQFYPRRAQVMGQQGEVQIRFTITKEGLFSNIEILEKSPFDILNEAAFELMVSLKSFKPLPDEYQGKGEFIIPIRYVIKAQ
jgi:TonB family protein